MRLSKRRGGDMNRVALNMASMIDVTFLLLIYFMVTMIVRADEDHLSPSLQTQQDAAAGAERDFEPQIIEVSLIEGAPAYRLGGLVLRDRAGLEEAVAPLPRDQGIFVRVGAGVPVGFAVTALQVGHDAGFIPVTWVPVDDGDGG